MIVLDKIAYDIKKMIFRFIFMRGTFKESKHTHLLCIIQLPN